MPQPADHFTAVAAHYAQWRPRYPDELFAWLAGIAPRRGLAWDVGAGSGQASVGLARHFGQVEATDLSARQLESAQAHPRVVYRAARAEESGLASGSVDLVTVAQALHWFDLEPFHAEVRRVLRPGGVIAEWSYGVLEIEGAKVDALVQRFYREAVGPYWPAERRHVEEGYAALPFPFTRLAAPSFAMQVRWDLDALIGYVRSWSSMGRMQAATGVDPLTLLAPALEAAWGPRETRRRVAWPLALRVGRV